MRKSKNFDIPQSFLSSLNEYTNGGFLIFTFDEDGNPVVINQFDSQIHAVAMHSYVNKWSQALDEINNQIIFNNILSQAKTRKKS